MPPKKTCGSTGSPPRVYRRKIVSGAAHFNLVRFRSPQVAQYEPPPFQIFALLRLSASDGQAGGLFQKNTFGVIQEYCNRVGRNLLITKKILCTGIVIIKAGICRFGDFSRSYLRGCFFFSCSSSRSTGKRGHCGAPRAKTIRFGSSPCFSSTPPAFWKFCTSINSANGKNKTSMIYVFGVILNYSKRSPKILR